MEPRDADRERGAVAVLGACAGLGFVVTAAGGLDAGLEQLWAAVDLGMTLTALEALELPAVSGFRGCCVVAAGAAAAAWGGWRVGWAGAG